MRFFLFLIFFPFLGQAAEWTDAPTDTTQFSGELCRGIIAGEKKRGRELHQSDPSRRRDRISENRLERLAEQTWLTHLKVRDEFIFATLTGMTTQFQIGQKVSSALADSRARRWLKDEYGTGERLRPYFLTSDVFSELKTADGFLPSLGRAGKKISKRWITDVAINVHLRQVISTYRLEFSRALAQKLNSEREPEQAERNEVLDSLSEARHQVLSGHSDLKAVPEFFVAMAKNSLPDTQARFRKFWKNRESLPVHFRRDLYQDLGFINFLRRWELAPDETVAHYYQSLETLIAQN